jgi:hypothetical protein
MNKSVKCCICEAEIDKDAIGLNKKLLGRGNKKLFCMNCLAVHVDASVEDLYTKINEFRDQGCALFM